MSGQSPSYDALVAELRVLWDRGPEHLREIEVPGLTEAALHLQPTLSTPASIVPALRMAADALGGGSMTAAVARLFGVAPGWIGRSRRQRREGAAAALGKAFRTFRESYEAALISQTADSLLLLLDQAGSAEKELVRSSDDRVATAEDVDLWLEEGVSLLAKNSFAPALELADRLVHALEPSPKAHPPVEFGQALLLQGHARRDLGRLGGSYGAYSSYLRAEAAFADRGEESRAASAILMQAVCVEMSGHLPEARRLYEQVAAKTHEGTLTNARARLWIGTTATKQGDLASAQEQIAASMSALSRLQADRQLMNAHMKLALVHANSGEGVRAWALLEEVRPDLARGRDIETVKLELASADILRLLNDRDGVMEHLASAWPIIESLSLGHQAERHNAILRSVTDARPRPHHEILAVRGFVPVMQGEIMVR